MTDMSLTNTHLLKIEKALNLVRREVRNAMMADAIYRGALAKSQGGYPSSDDIKASAAEFSAVLDLFTSKGKAQK